MPKLIQEFEDKQKHTLWLYKGDFEKLGSFFPDVGASIAIRRLVRKTIEKLEAKITQPDKIKGNLDV